MCVLCRRYIFISLASYWRYVTTKLTETGTKHGVDVLLALNDLFVSIGRLALNRQTRLFEKDPLPPVVCNPWQCGNENFHEVQNSSSYPAPRVRRLGNCKYRTTRELCQRSGFSLHNFEGCLLYVVILFDQDMLTMLLWSLIRWSLPLEIEETWCSWVETTCEYVIKTLCKYYLFDMCVTWRICNYLPHKTILYLLRNSWSTW